MVHYTIDEALQSVDTIPRRVQQLVQQKLDALESGIRVVQMQLVSVKWPMQVDEAFEAYVAASQQQRPDGHAGPDLRRDDSQQGRPARWRSGCARRSWTPSATSQQREALWSQVTGDAQEMIAQAQAYQTKVVEAARANANYLMSILPEYRKRPELVARELYLAAIQEVLTNADEKFILDRCERRQGA